MSCGENDDIKFQFKNNNTIEFFIIIDGGLQCVVSTSFYTSLLKVTKLLHYVSYRCPVS